MSLEQAIHSRWASDASLIALLPASRFTTGKALGGAALPYAALSRQGVQDSVHTSSRRVDAIHVRFDVWANDLTTGKQVSDAVKARFDGQSFTEGGVNVLRMRNVDVTEVRADDGTWRLTLDYVAKV